MFFHGWKLKSIKDISKKRKIKINTEEEKNRSNQEWSGRSPGLRDEKHIEMSLRGRLIPV